MIFIGRKIDYEQKIEPVFIDSIEASHVYMNEIKAIEASHVYMNEIKEDIKQDVEYNIGKKEKQEWIKFEGITVKKSVLNDSLFLRFMNNSLTRKKKQGTYDCHDFIVLKFQYGVNCKCGGKEYKINTHDLRTKYYKEGVDYTFIKMDRDGKVVAKEQFHYKMLMRPPGKAKDGECVFIREELHKKAINFLTMGFYHLMCEKAKINPDEVFKIVELSAYQTLTTASACDFIRIPLENILIIEDKEVYSDSMKARVVKNEDVRKTRKEFQVDFSSPQLESIINKRGFTLDADKATTNPDLTLIEEKTKQALKNHGLRINGKYPGFHKEIAEIHKECTVTLSENEKIKNVLWDGMGLIDESIFPENMEGFIYCRSHFFKSCLFRGNIQEFFQDYCNEHDLDYDTHTVEKADMFNRKIRLSDIKVIITDKSIKWMKFIDMMGGTQKKAYKYYERWMKKYDFWFSIVKTAHLSKWGEMQLSTYQMNNSLPTTDGKILRHISDKAISILNDLKSSDEKYLQYLKMKSENVNADSLSMDKVVLELVKWNDDFLNTEIFRRKKSNDISKLKERFCQGRLPQIGDNLTIMDNPIALFLTVLGAENPLEEGCFELRKDGVECYTPRFQNGEHLAAFRSPHNSPNNIMHLYNVWPDKLRKYFPKIGNNVIVFNAIKTDTQPRLSGHDLDSDFVYVTNQNKLADLARKAYIEYPTIINKVEEIGISNYHFTLEDYAKMDNAISDTQESIGTSTDIAQLALSYYYHGGMKSKELENCFVILSVLGQISIDLAKKEFDIDVVKEIRRIRQLHCMQTNMKEAIPQFFADTKKSRNNKEYKKDITKKRLNCPMDILAAQIEKKTKRYAGRHPHLPLRKLLQKKEFFGKGVRHKKEKIIKQAESYNESIKWIEDQKTELGESNYYLLRQRAVRQFLYRADKNLDEETIMLLVDLAFYDENSDIRGAILNYLYKNYRDKFLNCFVKKEQKSEENIA